MFEIISLKRAYVLANETFCCLYITIIRSFVTQQETNERFLWNTLWQSVRKSVDSLYTLSLFKYNSLLFNTLSQVSIKIQAFIIFCTSSSIPCWYIFSLCVNNYVITGPSSLNLLTLDFSSALKGHFINSSNVITVNWFLRLRYYR